MRVMPRVCWMIAGLAAIVPPASAQPSPCATSWLVGGETAAFRTSNPHGGSAGLGFTLATDHVLSRNGTLHDRRSRWRTGWRGGVELALGSGRRAPRVQYARSMYSRATLDLTGLHNIALLLPF